MHRLLALLLFCLLLDPTRALLAADLRVGIDNNPPLTFIDDQKRATGLFPELINRVADQQIKAWKQSPDSLFYQLQEKWLGGNQPPGPPDGLVQVLYVLAGGISLLLAALYWVRRQVKRKTRELDDKNRLLERELNERSRIEQELRERQQQYQVFFEESHSVMLLVDPESAAIVDANPAACRFYQYTREQLQQMKMWQINRLEENQVLARLEKVKRQKNQQFEFVHMRADGSEVPVEVYRSPIEVQGRPLLYAIIHDISQRKEAEKALQQRHYFLQSVIDGVTDPLMVIGLDYKILTMNIAARRQVSNGLAHIDDITCHQLSHASLVPCDGKKHPCPLSEIYQSHAPVTLIHHHTSEQGPRIVELTASPLFTNSGELYAIIEVARDITERLQMEELLSENEKRLHHLAHHDALTGLPNRLLFDDRLKQAISKSKRHGKQVALFFLDLDHLKDVNDNLGHEYGDLLLVEVAKRLGKAVRESDTVARLGGDEFLVLLEDIDSIAMVEVMAERIGAALKHELRKDNFSLQISSSIGISIFPEDAGSGEEMMWHADKAMYRVKHAGKNDYQFYAEPQGHFPFD